MSRWNGNDGSLEKMSGMQHLNQLMGDLNFFSSRSARMSGITSTVFETVQEEDENDEDNDEDDEDEDENEDAFDVDAADTHQAAEAAWNSSASVSLSDYPQAFSHFSYVNSEGVMLVCDIQGTLDKTAVPPKFELTDPVIHNRVGNKHKYGRTDMGEHGIKRFFSTHCCNALCKLLNLGDPVVLKKPAPSEQDKHNSKSAARNKNKKGKKKAGSRRAGNRK